MGPLRLPPTGVLFVAGGVTVTRSPGVTAIEMRLESVEPLPPIMKEPPEANAPTNSSPMKVSGTLNIGVLVKFLGSVVPGLIEFGGGANALPSPSDEVAPD